jgi:hypothetical protein
VCILNLVLLCPLAPSPNRHVKEADKDIIAHIKAAGRLVDHSTNTNVNFLCFDSCCQHHAWRSIV